MMRNNQLRARAKRLGGTLRGDRQTGHDPLHRSLPVTQKQTDIIPLGRQMRRGEFLEEFDHRADVDHDVFFAAMWHMLARNAATSL